MSDKGITIVVKGTDGTGRTLIVETIKRALQAEGFSDLTVLGTEVDLYQGSGSIKDQNVQIAELKLLG